MASIRALTRSSRLTLLTPISKRTISIKKTNNMPPGTEADKILEGMEKYQRELQREEARSHGGRVDKHGKAATIKSELDHVKAETSNAQDAVRNYKRDTQLFEAIETQEIGKIKKGGPAANLQSAYSKGVFEARGKTNQVDRKAQKGGSSQLNQDKAEIRGETDHPFVGEFLDSKEKI